MSDLDQLAQRLKEVNVTGALRAAFGKCPTCAKPVDYGYWLKWCNKCKYVAPITKTQRLELDEIVAKEHAMILRSVQDA